MCLSWAPPLPQPACADFPPSSSTCVSFNSRDLCAYASSPLESSLDSSYNQTISLHLEYDSGCVLNSLWSVGLWCLEPAPLGWSRPQTQLFCPYVWYICFLWWLELWTSSNIYITEVRPMWWFNTRGGVMWLRLCPHKPLDTSSSHCLIKMCAVFFLHLLL